MDTDYDLVVIGGGPAGMTAAQYGARANLRTLVIEEMAAGGAMLTITKMENYPGFPEPVNGYEFSEKMRAQTVNFGAEFKSAAASRISKNGDVFTVETSDGTFTAWSAVLSTGARHKHLGAPGEEEFAGRGVSYCAACDGPFFRDKRILVVGGGDAACDEASYLANLTDRVVMIHRRGRFRAQGALADRVHQNPRIDVRLNHTLERIEGDSKVHGVLLKRTDTGETYGEEMDAVFVFIGSDPRTSLVPDLEKDEAGYVKTDQSMESSMRGLYVAGDVRSTPFRQVAAACGEGAIAAHAAAARVDEIKGEACAGLQSA